MYYLRFIFEKVYVRTDVGTSWPDLFHWEPSGGGKARRDTPDCTQRRGEGTCAHSPTSSTARSGRRCTARGTGAGAKPLLLLGLGRMRGLDLLVAGNESRKGGLPPVTTNTGKWYRHSAYDVANKAPRFQPERLKD